MQRLFIFVSVLFCVGCNSGDGSQSRTAEQGTVSFVDPALEEIIREQLNKPLEPITVEDALSLQALDLSGSMVVSILGLDALKNLIYLDIRDTQVTNLAVLAKMPQLETLKLKNNHKEMKNISVLSTLTNLKELDILYFDDWSFLYDLPQIETLAVYGPCGIEDPEGCVAFAELLLTFDSLKYLDVRSNYFQDLSFFTQLPDLEFLDLSYNDLGLDDLTPLAALKKLKKLVIINSYVSDISPLAELPLLEEVELKYNCITDFTSVADVPVVLGADEQTTCF